MDRIIAHIGSASSCWPDVGFAFLAAAAGAVLTDDVGHEVGRRVVYFNDHDEIDGLTCRALPRASELVGMWIALTTAPKGAPLVIRTLSEGTAYGIASREEPYLSSQLAAQVRDQLIYRAALVEHVSGAVGAMCQTVCGLAFEELQRGRAAAVRAAGLPRHP